MIYLTLFLQAQDGYSTLILMAGMLIIAFFFFIRPQQKKQKEQTQYMDALKKGDEVVTASGILGRINKIEGDIIHLQVDTKTFIRVTRGAISKEMSDSITKNAKEEKQPA